GPNLELCGHPPYNTALYHTIAASSHITPLCGILDGVLRYNTSLDGLIRRRAVFGALGACYTVPCCLTHLRTSKDGSSLYSSPSGTLFDASNSRTLSRHPTRTCHYIMALYLSCFSL